MILEYIFEEGSLKMVYELVLCRPTERTSFRFTPGEYLSVDPNSRTFAVAAIEKNITFVSLNANYRTPQFCPREEEMPGSVICDAVPIYNGCRTPIFAFLEAQYEDSTPTHTHKKKNTSESMAGCSSSQTKEPQSSPEQDQIPDSTSKRLRELGSEIIYPKNKGQEINWKKLPPMHLKLYEWDLKCNKLTQVSFEMVTHANKLISVPPRICHNGGVLICALNEVCFLESITHLQAQCFVPLRRNLLLNHKGMLISTGATYDDEHNEIIFLQSEEGDLYAVDICKCDKKLKINITYVDTVPTSSAMCIIEGGFLFLGADIGDHYLYKIKSLGSEDEIVHFRRWQVFTARELKNLDVVSKIGNISPVINCIASHYACTKYCHHRITSLEDHRCSNFLQLYVTSGSGDYSSLRTLTYGVEVTELQRNSIDFYPNAVWPFIEKTDDGFITRIVVSFDEFTRVLSMEGGEKTFPESDFDAGAPTLNFVQVNSDSVVQVLPCSFRYIYQKYKKEWKPECSCPLEEKPEEVYILDSTIYKDQIALALSCREIVYLDVFKFVDGTVDFSEKRCRLGAICIEFVTHAPRAEILVACSRDSMFILSLHFEQFMCVHIEKLYSVPTSLVVSSSSVVNQWVTYIHIGFENGSVGRFILDRENHVESHILMHLGAGKVKLLKVKINADDAVLALTNQTWISFSSSSKFNLVPLLYRKIEYAAAFASTQWPFSDANLIVLCEGELVFLWIDSCASMVTDNHYQCDFAPRQSVFSDVYSCYILSLNDHRPLDMKEGDVTPQIALDLYLGISRHTPPNPRAKYFYNMMRDKPSVSDCELYIFHPILDKFVLKLQFPRYHVTGRMCLAGFRGCPKEEYLFVVVKHWIQPEEKWDSYLYVYGVEDNGRFLSLDYKISMDSAPGAICSFLGVILIGVGKKLHLCNSLDPLHFKASMDFPSNISQIYARGKIFIVVCEDCMFYGCWYKRKEKLFNLHKERFVDKISTLCFWDDTVIFVADAHGYLHVILLPELPKVFRKYTELPVLKWTSKQAEEPIRSLEPPTIEDFKITRKSYNITKYFLGELVTSLHRTSFMMEGSNVLLYTTMSGTMGVVVPFFEETKDSKFFKCLEFLIKRKKWSKSEVPEWLDDYDNVYKVFKRDTAPHMIDGNLCDTYCTLPVEDQQKISDYLWKEPYHIIEKCNQMKARIFFGGKEKVLIGHNDKDDNDGSRGGDANDGGDVNV